MKKNTKIDLNTFNFSNHTIKHDCHLFSSFTRCFLPIFTFIANKDHNVRYTSFIQLLNKLEDYSYYSYWFKYRLINVGWNG